MTRALALAAAVAVLGLKAATPSPHLALLWRAPSRVTLEHTSGAVLAARGRMAVEFRDTCDGWTTSQRLIADMTELRKAC